MKLSKIVIFEKNTNRNFFEKNDNFWNINSKKYQVFDNFLTFKWQFSGGSGLPLVRLTVSTSARISLSPGWHLSSQLLGWTLTYTACPLVGSLVRFPPGGAGGTARASETVLGRGRTHFSCRPRCGRCSTDTGCFWTWSVSTVDSHSRHNWTNWPAPVRWPAAVPQSGRLGVK